MTKTSISMRTKYVQNCKDDNVLNTYCMRIKTILSDSKMMKFQLA